MTRIPFRRIFWLGAAGILILAALVGIAAVVGGDFSFEEAGAAQTMITERRNIGKVVLVS